MYNYLFSSCDMTFIIICSWTSECKFKTTLKSPSDFISLTGCIMDGLILIFTLSSSILEISVGLTDPYNSLFSVLSFSILNTLFFIFSWIDFASFFFSWSFLFNFCLIISTSFMFSFEAKSAFFFDIRKFLENHLFTSIT